MLPLIAIPTKKPVRLRRAGCVAASVGSITVRACVWLCARCSSAGKIDQTQREPVIHRQLDLEPRPGLKRRRRVQRRNDARLIEAREIHRRLSDRLALP